MATEGTEQVGDVTAGSSGAASGAAGSTTSTGSTASSATGSGSPTPAPKWEDDPRAKGMLADLQKERKARQEYERRQGEYEAQLSEERRRVAALTGIKTLSKEETEIQDVRDRFAQLYPELAGLTKEDIDAIRELKASQEQLQQTISHHWTTHSKAMLESVYKDVASEIGDLSDRQKRRIAALYVNEAEADPEFLKRHDAGDQTLIKEFVKNFLDDTVEPARRKTIANEVGRNRIVPNGGNRSVPASGGKAIDMKDDKAVMDFIMESRKGQFGR